MDSARDTWVFARSTAFWTSATTFSFVQASASDMSGDWPWLFSQAGSISRSRLTSAAMNGFCSPTTITWSMIGSARIGSSSTAGETFLPPAVTMISFLRPVIVR